MKISIKYKILFPILSIIGIMYITTMGYLINKMYVRNINDGKQFIDAIARENANMISENLSREIHITRTLANTFETAEQISKEKQKKFHLDIIKNVATKNLDFLSIGISRQLFVLDKNWKKKYGRERYTYFREIDGSLSLEDITLDKKGEDKNGLYHKIRKNNIDVLLDPYFGDFNEGKKKLMTSICIPVRKNDKFIGLTVTDISLERLNNIIIKIKPVMGLNAFLLSNSGTYVVHTDSALVGKFIGDIQKNTVIQFEIDKLIKQGKSISFIDDNKDDEKYYVSFVPVKFGGDIKPWSLAVAVPMSELVKEAKETVFFASLIGIVGLIITIFFIIIIANSIVRPIIKSVDFAKKIAEGDLTANIFIKDRNDEINELVRNLEYMVANLKKMISKVKETVTVVKKNSNYLKTSSYKVSEGNNIQASSAEEVAASIQEMSAVIEQNTNNANKTALIADNSAKNIKISEKNAILATKLMEQIAEKIIIIDEIAFQTNILSLNTAIEASHAEQYGKGFAIVARDINRLADKSKILAFEIKEMSEKSLSISQKTSALLKAIVPSILKTSELVNYISVSSKEQNVGAIQVNNAVNNLNQIIQQNTNEAFQMAEQSKILAKYANYLNESITFFKT